MVFIGFHSDLNASFQGFFCGLLQPSCCCYLVILLCLAFHQAPSILNASFGLFSGIFLCPAHLVVLFWLALLSVSLFLILLCFSGVVHMLQLWQGDFPHNCKQVVNRLKIPQGLSTLLFHRWSEVPSRGGVRGDSPYKKLPALQRCHMSVFSECCF